MSADEHIDGSKHAEAEPKGEQQSAVESLPQMTNATLPQESSSQIPPSLPQSLSSPPSTCEMPSLPQPPQRPPSCSSHTCTIPPPPPPPPGPPAAPMLHYRYEAMGDVNSGGIHRRQHRQDFRREKSLDAFMPHQVYEQQHSSHHHHHHSPYIMGQPDPLTMLGLYLTQKQTSTSGSEEAEGTELKSAGDSLETEASAFLAKAGSVEEALSFIQPRRQRLASKPGFLCRALQRCGELRHRKMMKMHKPSDDAVVEEGASRNRVLGGCAGGGDGEEEMQAQLEAFQRLLVSQFKKDPKAFTSEDLSILFQALAEGGCTDREGSYAPIMRELNQVKRLEALGHAGVQRTLWALVRALELKSTGGGILKTAEDSAVCRAVAEEAKRRGEDFVKGFSAQQLASICQSLSTLGHKDVELLQLLGVQILRHQSQFSPQDWSTCVQVFSRFAVPLRGDCKPIERSKERRTWERPPPPKRPKPLAEC